MYKQTLVLVGSGYTLSYSQCRAWILKRDPDSYNSLFDDDEPSAAQLLEQDIADLQDTAYDRQAPDSPRCDGPTWTAIEDKIDQILEYDNKYRVEAATVLHPQTFEQRGVVVIARKQYQWAEENSQGEDLPESDKDKELEEYLLDQIGSEDDELEWYSVDLHLVGAHEEPALLEAARNNTMAIMPF